VTTGIPRSRGRLRHKATVKYTITAARPANGKFQAIVGYDSRLQQLQAYEKQYLNDPEASGGKRKSQIVPLIRAKRAFKDTNTICFI
jgi:hypothetical protein